MSTPMPRTIPQVLDRIADQFSNHDALVTDERQFTLRASFGPRSAGPPRR